MTNWDAHYLMVTNIVSIRQSKARGVIDKNKAF